MSFPKPTWIGNADANATSLELGAVQFKCLLETIERSELDIAEAFGLAV
jgi:hypothetical protein